MQVFAGISFPVIVLILSLSQSLIAQLRIDIDNLNNKESSVYVAIFDKEETFLGDSSMYSKIIHSNNKSLSVIINELSAGQYAVAVFQDLNNNGKLDRNLFGIPEEPHGFSGIKAQKNAPPKFEEASFNFETQLILQINMLGTKQEKD